ncbi:MAG: fatty acid desaturase [bacterium]
MTIANRLRPLDVFTDQEWAELSRRQSWRGPLLVLHAWGLIAVAMALVAIWPNPVTYILAVMTVGTRQLGLAILMHEAAHGALAQNKHLNHFLGHWLCAAPIGVHLEAYRRYHLNHHKYVQGPDDPDLPLAAKFPTTGKSLRRKFIRDITGQTFLKQRLNIRLNTSRDDIETPDLAISNNKNGLRDHLIFNSGLFIALALIGYWWLFPALWLVALATWFPLVTRIRNIAEHGCVVKSDDPLAHARTTHANWWERLFIAPYWVHYHSEHHAFMHLPCYRLAAAHRLLKAKGLGDRIIQAKSYSDVLKDVSSV